jgi:hypothetical protein
MYVEKTIAEVEWLEGIYLLPDTRPLKLADRYAANQRHDEKYAENPRFRLWQRYGIPRRVGTTAVQQPWLAWRLSGQPQFPTHSSVPNVHRLAKHHGAGTGDHRYAIALSTPIHREQNHEQNDDGDRVPNELWMRLGGQYYRLLAGVGVHPQFAALGFEFLDERIQFALGIAAISFDSFSIDLADRRRTSEKPP